MTPTEHRFAGPEGEICWFEWGQAGKGPSILLLHATGFHARCWDRVVSSLPEGVHIVAPDLRGHGRSFRPGSISDWSATATDIVALAAQTFDGPVVAVGHSMGGAIAVRATALRPDGFARLFLVDPVLMARDLYSMPQDHSAGDPADHPVARRRNDWDSVEQMIERFSERAPYSGWRADVLHDYCLYGLVPATDGKGFELACPPRLEASAYMGATWADPYPLFANVICPVSVLRAPSGDRAGPLDFSLSPTWPGLADEFSNGRDIYWDDVTHFAPMEAPERLAALIAEEQAAAR